MSSDGEVIRSLRMATKISFADLTHTGQLVSANVIPLGIAMVASYAKKALGDEVEFQLFKYPEDYNQYLSHTTPRIAGFSLFAWNNHLSHEYARRLKAVAPETIVVFGGPNWPNDPPVQKTFLKKWYAADFCVEGEGEVAFVELYNILKDNEFNVDKIKRDRIKIPNTAYLTKDGEYVKGPILPRIEDLESVPSVFEAGLMDKFFDEHLMSIFQTSRGCPYQCTFCHDGASYFNKIRRVSDERVKREIDYIAARARAPDVYIADLNFGINEQDIRTAQYLAAKQEEVGWPKFVIIATSKNDKKRVLEISRILRGSVDPGGAVQSTDPEVLKAIKRTNLPMEALLEVARTAETDGAASVSEIILCLPGDSKRAYLKSVKDVLDTGFTLIRSYQFQLLAGTEAADQAARGKYKYITRFRVKPMNFGYYEFRGERFPSAEIEEICVANSTMTYQDYRDCREMSLTVEMFNNNGIFFDIVQFLSKQGILRSDFIFKILDLVHQNKILSKFYKDFAPEEESNLRESGDELRAFTLEPGVVEKYIKGEYGINEIYKYRAIAVFYHMAELHEVAYAAARELLREKGLLDERTEQYVNELQRFSLMRKEGLFDMNGLSRGEFHFDFVKLLDGNFASLPFDYHDPRGIEVEVYHTEKQKKTIMAYIDQFGDSLVGLGRILNRAHIASMHRSARYTGRTAERENRVRIAEPVEKARAIAGPTGGDQLEQY
ncbi:MAG: hypothetical protein A3G34_10945 [Candidatus Lindowbacteria bacterium RIFCSPLOWO2_12_FULL_62_27]|nr:MAG: hypothetical protein A3G34_10945 [Candidatus Lindowbacteria bacterium RIFCSPLOWO2_12_FULL_62_27]